MEFLLNLLDADILTALIQNPGNVAANTVQEVRYLGMPLYDSDDFWKLLKRFLFTIGSTGIIAGLIYFPNSKRKDYLFTYILISITVFFLCFLLENVKIELAFALGLFAVFGIIRYRTDPIPIREMTYLFIIIGVSVVNALVNKKVSLAELILANAAIISAAALLEYLNLLRNEVAKTVLYEKIDLIKPERRAELIQDLTERTGLKINKVDVGKIDFLRDVASLTIYYYEKDQNRPSRPAPSAGAPSNE